MTITLEKAVAVAPVTGREGGGLVLRREGGGGGHAWPQRRQNSGRDDCYNHPAVREARGRREGGGWMRADHGAYSVGSEVGWVPSTYR